MCVIVYSQNGKKLSEEKLKIAWEKNPDGAGIYILNDKKMIKGIMKFKDFMKVYRKINSPYVFHFRLGSSGSDSPENTHPFYFADKTHLLFHNGHISKGIGKKSDTAILASILTKGNYRKILLCLFENQRFAIVNCKTNNVEVFGDFVKIDNGIIASNSYSFVDYSYYYYNSYYNYYSKNNEDNNKMGFNLSN